MTVNACGQITYTMKVINGGTSPLTAVNVQDNIGSAATPEWVQATAVTSTGGYNVGDSNKNGILDPGESWTYSETINQINATAIASGSVTHTPTGSYLTSGNTAWLSTTFNAPSSQNGATYVFQGIKCTFTGTGVGATPLVEKCPDAVITFSSSCTSPATHYDNVRNAWVTTLPAGGNPGSIFMSGLPVPIPAGVDLSKSSATFTIDDAGDNVGASTITWDGTCKGFANFNQNGCSGSTDFNQIGVKVCDDSSHYGSGGNCNTGYGWNGSCYSSNSYYNSYNYNYGCGSNYNNWIGSGSDCAGTPENQYTQYNCNTGSYSSSCGGYSGSYGWSGGYNCYSSSSYGCCGYGGYSDGSYDCYSSSSYSCGSSGGYYNSGYGCGNDGYYGGNGCYDYQYSYNCNSNYYSGCNYSYGGSCGGGGSATNNLPTTGITGAADSVTVTATTATGTTVTATDTKEVMVLAGSNVQVCGTATTAGLTTTYGTAQTLEFTYNPSNTVALKQVQAGLGTSTGSNSNSMAFIEISNNANPFASNATIYFEGNVATGQKIYADATLNPLTNTAVAAASAHFDTTAGANIFAYVFNSAADLAAGAAPVQTITYNTSGSQVMHIGDQIGSLTLAGFVGSKGGYLVS